MRWMETRVAPMGAALILGCLFTACGGDYEEEGKQAFAAGNLRLAADFLEVSLREREDAEARLFLGVSLHRLGRNREAEAVLSPLAEAEGETTSIQRRAVRELAGTYIDLGDSDSAERLVAATLLKVPDDPSLVEALAGVQAARYLAIRTRINLFVASLLGEDRANQATNLVGAIITAPAGLFEKVFRDNYARLESEFAFTERRLFEELASEAHRALGVLEATLDRLVTLDSTAFASRMELAEISWQRRDWDATIRSCQAILELDAEDVKEPERRMTLGGVRIRAIDRYRSSMEAAGRNVEAITFLEGLIERPFGDAVLPHLARLYYQEERAAELSALAATWLKREPRQPWAAFYRGWALFRLGDFDAAVPYLERARGSSPRIAAFNHMLGLAYEKAGAYSQSLVHLQRARDLRPNEAGVIIDISRVYSVMNDNDHAREILIEAIKGPFRNRKSEGHQLIMDRLFDLYQKAGQVIDDVAVARRLNDQDPDNPHVALRLAQLEAEGGNVARARVLVEGVQSMLPELADAWRVGAGIAIDASQWTRALTQLRRLGEIDPQEPVISWMRAKAYLGQRRLDDARAEAERALDRDPTQVGVLSVLLQVELDQKNWTKAAAVGQRALRAFPDDRDALEGTAAAYVGAKDWKGARETLLRLEKIVPNDPKVLVSLGQTFQQTGYLDEAKTRFRRALGEVPPDALELRLEVGRGLFFTQEFAEAEAALTPISESAERGTPLWKDALTILARCRHHQNDYLGVCEAIVRLRRAGDLSTAYDVFIPLAHEAGAHAEVRAAFNAAWDEQAMDPSTMPFALKSLRTQEAWKEVLRVTGAMENKQRSLDVDLSKAEALFGIGDRRGSKAIFEALRDSTPESNRGEIYATWVRVLLRSGNVDGALAIARAGLGHVRNHQPFLVWAARASLASGDLDETVDLLREAWLVETSDEIAILAAAVNVARRSYQEGIAALAKASITPTSAAMLSLLQALGTDNVPATPGFPRFLALIRKREFESAFSTAREMTDVPATFRSYLELVGGFVQRYPDRAPALADVLGRAAILMHAGVLETEADREVATLAAQNAEYGPWLDIYRGWIHLGYGSTGRAIDILAPLIKADALTQQALIYVAGWAAFEIGGPKNVLLIVDGKLGQGLIPAELASDLARFLLERGEAATAELLLSRAKDPPPEQTLFRIGTLFRLGRVSEAATLAEKLPPALKAHPRVQFILAMNRAEGSTNPKDDEELRRILEDPRMWSLLDPIHFVGASIAARAEDVAHAAARRTIADHPYDAVVLGRIAELITNRPRYKALRDQIVDALSVVDPTGTIRRTGGI
jgi:tetratricopeptide (TPR) repeat protein